MLCAYTSSFIQSFICLLTIVFKSQGVMWLTTVTCFVHVPCFPLVTCVISISCASCSWSECSPLSPPIIVSIYSASRAIGLRKYKLRELPNTCQFHLIYRSPNGIPRLHGHQSVNIQWFCDKIHLLIRFDVHHTIWRQSSTRLVRNLLIRSTSPDIGFPARALSRESCSDSGES